jgi:hypothetical protein
VGTRTVGDDDVGDGAGSSDPLEPSEPDAHAVVAASIAAATRTAYKRRFPREVMLRP